jgi:hypothetical protein
MKVSKQMYLDEVTLKTKADNRERINDRDDHMAYK